MKIPRKSAKQKTLLLSVLIVASALLTAPAVVHRTAASGGGGGGLTQTPATFSNYELAGNPFVTNHSVGVSCPNTDSSCNNTEAEPAIRADPAGNFYGSSENVFCVIGGQCGGTFAWKSADGGNHFTTLPQPNSVSAGRPGVSPAGGDTDIAVAPKRNTNGFYNVYVASLHATLANIYVSTSTDGGASWIPNPTGASIPIDDREWIAADGASKVCISYHSVTTTNAIVVDCSYNAGVLFSQHASAFDGTHAPLFLALNNKIGNLAIDSRSHLIYQVFSSVADSSEIAGCLSGCSFHTVWIAVSIDQGNTFTDYIVYNNLDKSVDYGHAFVNVSVDKAGNVYVVYSDDHNLFYSFSRTFGQTWSGPFRINQAPSSKTAIYPWSVAGNSGQLDVVWYGTPYANGAQTPTDFPHCPTAGGTNAECLAVPWYVFFAQNVHATTPGTSFTQVAASGIIHYGDVCESGAGCGSDQNRDLLDDIGIAASPTTGRAAIIYTSDQFVGTAAEPAQNKGSRGGCTTSSSNTVDCSHTNIAVQTGGSTINQKPGHFEVDDEDFEELDVRNDGGHSTHGEIDMTNTGTVAINKFDVGIGGLPWTLTWGSTGPIQPGQSMRGTSSSVPVGLVLAVGNIYPVTIIATLADGTTETQTTNVIYSLGAGLGL